MVSTRPDKIIAEARERWRRCQEAEEKQRVAILAAKTFRAGDQWPNAIKTQREGNNAIQGEAPHPPRPCLVVDRLSQPCRQASNTIKTADIAFTVLPNSQGADEDVADILKGYLRRVQNFARDESPIEWAADQAIEGGIGWFRIRTEYVHSTWDGDPNDPAIFDQELRLERITNNLSVYDDPHAMKPTRSDAQFRFVTDDLAKDEFKRKYPKADVRGLEDFAATGDCPKEWVTKDTIRVAEYWRMDYQDRPFYWRKSTGKIYEGKPPKDLKDDLRMTRVMKVPIVKGSIINAFEELEQFDWAGSRIPIIPILGEELNIDGRVKLRGIVEEGMDAQRMVNYTYSGAMELFALAPKSPILAEARSVAAYRAIWQQANRVNYAYLPWDAFDTDSGRELPPPMRPPSDMGPTIQAAVNLMSVSEEAIKATTGMFDPSLGQFNSQTQSGRAIQSLQSQSDLASSNYPDNVRRAVVYAAELMLEIIPKITRKGQILHILGMDDEPDQVMVGQVYNKGGGALGPSTNIPQPSQNVTPEQAQLSQGLHKFYDLNNGTYHVTVTLGKATATKLQEGSAALGELIPHLPPEMAAVATPDYVEQLSFPGAHQIAEKLRKTLPANLQDQPPGPLPPQVQQMLQGMQGQLQQAQQAIATDQAKQQATIQKAQIDAQTSMQQAQLDSQTRLEIAKINAQAGLAEAEVKAGIADMQTRIRILETMIGVEKEARLEQQKQGHDVGITAMGHAHEQQLAAHQAIQDTLQRAHEASQAQQAQTAQATQQAQAQQASQQAQQANNGGQP